MTPARGPKTYIIWMAWRNLTAKQKRSGLSFMTVISIAGVALGVAALIVVLSVMGGFEADLKEKMLRGQPHLEVINKTAALGFSLAERPLTIFEKMVPEAKELEPYTQADVVMKQGRHLTSAILFGVDPARGGHLWGFGTAVTQGTLRDLGRNLKVLGSWDEVKEWPGIALGDELAQQLGADLGDEITVISPQAGVDTALGGGTVSRRFVVAALFSTGLFNYDAKWAVVSLDEGRKFMPDYDPSLDVEKYVTGVAMRLDDPMEVELIEKRLLGEDRKSPVPELAELDLLSWRIVNKSLLFALKLEKFAMGSILMLIVLVAGFSISGTMMMTVYHKRGQVSLLRSLGMTTQDVARLFLSHGATIGTVGIAVGVVLGLVICYIIHSFQFIPLPEGVYHLRSLPVRMLWGDYVVICISALGLSLAAAAYPAMTAARQDPGSGLGDL